MLKHQKIIILAALLLILVSGCKETRLAKAEKIRQKTRQMRDEHNQQMEIDKALEDDKVITASIALYSLVIGLSILFISMAIAGSIYILKIVNIEVHKRQVMTIESQDGVSLPVLIAGNYIVNLQTGEQFAIGQEREANPLLIQSSTMVKLAAAKQDKPDNFIVEGLKLLTGEK